jgi:hypothetical protein
VTLQIEVKLDLWMPKTSAKHETRVKITNRMRDVPIDHSASGAVSTAIAIPLALREETEKHGISEAGSYSKENRRTERGGASQRQ